MATCSLVLDKRVKLKNENYNLSIRIIDGKNQLYLNISKMTERQYNKIFIKKDMGQNTIEFRRQCQEQITKAEKIISHIKVFDRNIIKQSFFKKNTQENQTETTQISLKLDDLFKTYCEENEHLSIRTKIHIKQSKNVFTRENNDLTILEVTPEFLKKIERKRLQEGVSISSINSNFRDLRTVINYFMKKKNVIPTGYFYPFGKGGYSICEYFPKKQVFTNDEISQIINLDKFESRDEEFARDIWELLYRCNGINFADLLRLRWDQRNGNCFVSSRKKTENIRKKNETGNCCSDKSKSTKYYK